MYPVGRVSFDLPRKIEGDSARRVNNRQLEIMIFRNNQARISGFPGTDPTELCAPPPPAQTSVTDATAFVLYVTWKSPQAPETGVLINFLNSKRCR